jgi:YHS domain-containing protein
MPWRGKAIMSRFALAASVGVALGWLWAGTPPAAAQETGAPAREIPAPFAPLEYLIGRWHGQGIPRDGSAQQFRGWSETHTWAWTFEKGKPAAMSVVIEGGRTLNAGKLSFDEARKLYHLEGMAATPAGRPVTFEGTLDRTGKLLILQSARKTSRGAGKVQLSVRPNANFIRYTMLEDRQEPGATRFSRIAEVGLTKEGESLAGAANASQRPKCIVTGGAATLTVSFQGQTYPICCTGCRDEFNENPEKYIKKAALLLKAQMASARTAGEAPSRVSRFEDAFANDVAASDVEARGNSAPKPTRSTGPAAQRPPAAVGKPSDSKDAARGAQKADAAKARTKPAARAATLLQLGQNLEKSGKPSAALDYYRRIAKEFPDTPSAKTATQRIKALAPD